MKGKIFNAQEVQAIIAGNKTMFREVIKPYPILSNDKSYWEFKGVIWAGENSSYAKNFGDNARPVMPDLCPYQVGQEIFCKESFVEHDNKNSKYRILFKASHQKLITHFLGSIKWRPAQHMKQEHSRLTLEITDTKVERLKDISEEDAIKEGIPLSKKFSDRYYTLENNYAVPKIAFIKWWNANHKKPEEKFSSKANPFVWVVDFKINK